ncbi:MAG: alpha-ketoglutarate-dependent dioxygenase AlkB family protein [Bacteriovoracaceae bacterium]
MAIISQTDYEYIPGFLNTVCQLPGINFEKLRDEIFWEQAEIFLFGKKIKSPRLQAFIGDPKIQYTYSRTTFIAKPWTESLRLIKENLEDHTSFKFNNVLCNYYRDGMDNMGLHSDDEKELGDNPVIASLSLGDTRSFLIQSKTDKTQKINFELRNDDLFIMKNEFQKKWLHGIKKTKKPKEGRINLTFRFIPREKYSPS